MSTLPYFLTGHRPTMSAANRSATDIERDPRYRCMCNACHVTTGTKIIAIVQILLSLFMAFTMIAILASASERARTAFITDYYYAGGFSVQGLALTPTTVGDDADNRTASNESITDFTDSTTPDSSGSVITITEEDVDRKMKVLSVSVCLALFVELFVAVCLLLSVRLRRRWLMLPHLVTALLSFVTSVFRLTPYLFIGSVDRALMVIITISVEFFTFWVPWRCFLYLGERERVDNVVRWQRDPTVYETSPSQSTAPTMYNGGGVVIMPLPTPPPPSYSVAQMFPPAYEKMKSGQNSDAAAESSAMANQPPPPSYAAVVAEPTNHLH